MFHTDQERVQKILTELQNTPGTTNDPVLAVNQLEMQRAKNNGYPRHMYHERLTPVSVNNRGQEEAMAREGYVRNYILHAYPKFLFRRNLDPKFDARRDPATNAQLSEAFVEERLVKTAEDEAALRKMHTPKGCGPWCARIPDIEPIPEGPDEDPQLEIERLKGQLAEAQRKADKAK